MAGARYGARAKAYSACHAVWDVSRRILGAGHWWGHKGPRAVEMVRLIAAGAELAKDVLEPSADWPVVPPMLGALALSLAGAEPPHEREMTRWVRCYGGAIVAQVCSSGARISYKWSGSVGELAEVVGSELGARMPAAVLGPATVGVGPDRDGVVRALTRREQAIAERVGKYWGAGVHRSVLLYGPRGSAKTSLACSVSMQLAGSYLRVPSSALDEAALELLSHLRVKAVVIDDLDRHEGNALELLERLNAVVPLVWVTVNDAGALDSALTRPGRCDLAIEVSGLDAEARAEVVAAAGLEGVDLGDAGDDLLAAELVELGRRRRVGDLDDPRAAAAELVGRRAAWRSQLRSAG